MRIKVLRNLGRNLPKYNEGQVVDVDGKEAEKLIKLGLAEETDEDIGQTIQAVPGAPAIARAAQEPAVGAKRKTAPAAVTQPATPETIGNNPHDPSKK